MANQPKKQPEGTATPKTRETMERLRAIMDAPKDQKAPEIAVELAKKKAYREGSGESKE